ncbi:hypothetical protein IV203_005860 [Nitzschia inconspicua]|uniref:Uncharacterized protein n=1 Tax=Nitzschia inconspicua TaxID=303405 RepID=A0A9K3KNU5_9STRA|nr:hypothetical protein IV203_005860 [Nitzschia inconspicua]
MAFDMNIEADQIGDSDFNLLTSFVKIPLMILGGVLGVRNGSNVDDEDDLDGMIDAALARPSRMDSTYDDDAMDCSSLVTSLDNIDATTTNVAPIDDSSSTSPSNRIVSDNDIDEAESADGDGLKRSKKMSWSDSVGLRLVEYDDESLPHGPRIHPSKPSKSALKKMCNTGRDPSATAPGSNSKRFIPKMKGAGMIMPSLSGGNAGGSPALSNGYVSPEWGWYINTTPPTPEMYHNSSSFSASKLTRTDPVGAPNFPFVSSAVNPPPSISAGSGRRPKNTVFQNLQSSVTPNMGWTSVPI